MKLRTLLFGFAVVFHQSLCEGVTNAKDVELVVLEAGIGRSDFLVSKTEQLLKGLLEHLATDEQVRSFRLGAAVFGDKATTNHPYTKCWDPIFNMTQNLLKLESSERSRLETSFSTVYPQLILNNNPVDAASGIIHAATSGKLFSNNNGADDVARFLLIFTDRGCQVDNGSDGTTLKALREKMLCDINDPYPSDEDVRETLQSSGVIPIVLLTNYEQMSHLWIERFEAWGVPSSYIVPWEDSVSSVRSTPIREEILVVERPIANLMKSVLKLQHVCDASDAVVELMILLDSTSSMENYLHVKWVYPDTLKWLKADTKTFNVSISTFGDKPKDPKAEDDPHMCFRTWSKRWDPLENDLKIMDLLIPKQSTGVGPKDTGSAIIYSLINHDYFSPKQANDKVVRIMMIDTDDIFHVDDRSDMGQNAFKQSVPCKSTDRYPSQHDIKTAVLASGVVPTVILERDDPEVRDIWKSNLTSWNVPPKGVVSLGTETYSKKAQALLRHLKKQVCDIHQRFHPQSPIFNRFPDMPNIPVLSKTTSESTHSPSESTQSPSESTQFKAESIQSTAECTQSIPESSQAASQSTAGAAMGGGSSEEQASNTLKIVGGVAGAGAGVVLLGMAAYYGVPYFSSTKHPASVELGDMQRATREMVHGRREVATTIDENFYA